MPGEDPRKLIEPLEPSSPSATISRSYLLETSQRNKVLRELIETEKGKFSSGGLRVSIVYITDLEVVVEVVGFYRN